MKASTASLSNVILIQEELRVSYKGITGGWSKWGGARKQIASQNDHVEEVWNCQSCRTPQPQFLSPFLWEWPEDEYIRVCAICFAEGCSELMSRV